MNAQDKVGVGDAYRAMFKFLEDYYELTKSDEMASLLGSMSMTVDGGTMDPAMWDEWLSAVQHVVARADRSDV